MDELNQEAIIDEMQEDVQAVSESTAADAEANEGLRQSPPWHFYTNSIKKMFERDSEVDIVAPEVDDDGKFPVVVRCSSYLKCCALRALLPAEIPMGNIKYTIDIEFTEANPVIDGALIRAAFEGNDIVKEIVDSDPSVVIPFSTTYCVFQKEVLQFYNDDLRDPYGNVSVLAHDVANNIFNHDRSCVSYCISAED